jgi:BlaI family transcriptional regulator, penicillinase repressor
LRGSAETASRGIFKISEHLTYEERRSNLFVSMPDTPRPTDAELEILTVLWSRGPSTVRDVHETIQKRRPAQYTTVLKMLQIMAEKGLVVRDEAERAHVYDAANPREWTQRQLAGDLLRRAFDGSARSLMMGALSARKVSKQELAELRKLLDEHEKGTK